MSSQMLGKGFPAVAQRFAMDSRIPGDAIG